MSKIFRRTELLIGKAKFKQLSKARVAVLGLGAVGSYAVEGLARAGVENLFLVDCDVVVESNLNRQLYALHSTIGKKKTILAQKRVCDINPECRVEVADMFAHHYSIGKVLAFKPDLVIDAIDSLNAKVNVVAEIYRRDVPIISSMGAALKTDPSKIHFGDVFATRGCALARVVRRRLRRLGINKGIMCVYSTQATADEALADPEEGDDPGQGRPRNVMGSLSTVTGIFGLTLAHHAIEFLIGGFE